MKRTEVYQRNYKWEISEDRYDTNEDKNPKDKISEKLSDRCIEVDSDDTDSFRFLWYDEGVFSIEVLENSHIGDRHDDDNSSYKVRIEIEAMPETAPLPKGLVKLLKDHSFKKVKK